MIQKLFVKQFRVSDVNQLRYKIIKTLNLEDYPSTTEIGTVISGKELRSFAQCHGWEIEIS